jgi:hypothetical protein
MAPPTVKAPAIVAAPDAARVVTSVAAAVRAPKVEAPADRTPRALVVAVSVVTTAVPKVVGPETVNAVIERLLRVVAPDTAREVALTAPAAKPPRTLAPLTVRVPMFVAAAVRAPKVEAPATRTPRELVVACSEVRIASSSVDWPDTVSAVIERLPRVVAPDTAREVALTAPAANPPRTLAPLNVSVLKFVAAAVRAPKVEAPADRTPRALVVAVSVVTTAVPKVVDPATVNAVIERLLRVVAPDTASEVALTAPAANPPRTLAPLTVSVLIFVAAAVRAPKVEAPADRTPRELVVALRTPRTVCPVTVREVALAAPSEAGTRGDTPLICDAGIIGRLERLKIPLRSAALPDQAIGARPRIITRSMEANGNETVPDRTLKFPAMVVLPPRWVLPNVEKPISTA